MAVETILQMQAAGIPPKVDLELIRAKEDPSEEEIRGATYQNLINSLDEFAFRSMPAAVFEIIQTGIKSRADFDEALAALECANKHFPYAGQVTLMLGQLLVQPEDEQNLKKAVRILDEGRKKAFKDEIKEKITELLDKARTLSATAGLLSTPSLRACWRMSSRMTMVSSISFFPSTVSAMGFR